MIKPEVPSDTEVVAAIAAAPHGLTPIELIDAFSEHGEDQVIVAIQRVFDRGLVELANGAKLVVAQEDHILAA